MEEYGIADDGKPQAGASRAAASVGVEPVEALEYPLQLIRRHSAARVTVVQTVNPVRSRPADIYGAAVSGVFDGVLHEIAEYRIDELIVGRHADRRESVLRRDAVSLQRPRHLVRHLDEDGTEIDRRELELLRHFFQLGYQGDVRNHIGEAESLQIRALDKETPLVAVEFRMVDDGLQIALYAADGGLELVGDIARHLVLEPSRLAVGEFGLLALVAV